MPACASGRGKHLFRGLIDLLKFVEALVGEIRNGAEGGSRTHADYSQRILSPFEGILTDLTKRDEPIFTGRAAVKVMLRPVRSRDRMSSF